jgi:hypothetical protein
VKASAHRLTRAPVRIPASSLPAPVVTYLVASRTWLLEQAYAYRDGPHRIVVPAGFEFDLASVPRSLWSLIAPFELSIAAPLLHDFLYRYRGRPPAGSVVPPRAYSRAQTDRLFERIIEEEGVPAWRRWLAYRSVRLLAWHDWR